MGKIYLKKNGEEVQIGETISYCTKFNTKFGKVETSGTIMVTEEIVPLLVKMGILVKDTPTTTKGINTEISYYINKLGRKLGWAPEKMARFLDNIDAIYPIAAFNILLREIAIELDTQYEDHIENSPEIYAISNLDGRITKVNKALVRNYRNFAAFRSIEDAKIACKIMREVLKDLYAKK